MERIGDGIRRELGRFGPAAGMAELVTAWPAAVGPEIARNAWPARLARDGTLHVAASSSTWAFELTQVEGAILDRLRQSVGDAAPSRLRFAPGPLPEPAAPEDRAPVAKAVEPSSEELDEAARLASGISDENLRKVVARAVAASLARGASDRAVW